MFTLPYKDKGTGTGKEEVNLESESGAVASMDGETASMSGNSSSSDGDASSINGDSSSSEATQDLDNVKPACILVAEDTDSNFDLLEAILGKKHRLIRAHDGMEAVIMYDEVKPDLILMDIKCRIWMVWKLRKSFANYLQLFLLLLKVLLLTNRIGKRHKKPDAMIL